MLNRNRILRASFFYLVVSLLSCLLLNATSASQISVSTFSSPVNREIADRFIAAQKEFDRGNYTGGMKLLREVASLKELAGIENLPLFSAVLLKRLEIGEAMEGLAVRLEMAEVAVNLSPDMPHPYFKAAELYFSDSFDLASGSAMLLEGLKRTVLFPPALSAFIRGISYYTIIVYSIFALIFSILMVVKYFKPISHKLKDLAPFITDFQASFLLILILLLPVAANLGFILISMIYLLTSALFQTRRELFITTALLLSGFVVFACGKSLSIASEFEYGMGKPLYECLYADCSDYYQSELIKNHTEPLASEALGLFYAKRAHLDEQNLKFAEKYLKYGVAFSADEKASGRALLNLAFLDLASAIMNCRLEAVHNSVEKARGGTTNKVNDERISHESLKRFDAVIGKFEKAAATGIYAGYAHYGMGLSYKISGRNDQMAKEFTSGMEKGDSRIVRLIENRASIADSSLCGERSGMHNRVIPWLYPSTTEIFMGTSAMDAASLVFGRSLYPLQRIVLGGFDDMILPFVSFCSVIIFAILIFVRKRVKLPEYCVKCGSFSCPICNLKSSGFESCMNCLKSDSLDLYKDPIKEWKRARRAERIRGMKRFLRAIFSLFLPGAGQIMLNRTFKGSFLLAISAVVAALSLQPDEIFTDSYSAVINGTGFTLHAAALFAIVYLLSLIDIILLMRRG